MLYRTIPGLARKASAIILGSGGLGTGERLEHTFATLDAYVAIGGNWIDAARIYGNPPGDVEKAIGEWLRARRCRDQIILATKGAHPPFQDMHAGRLDRASIRSDLAASLEALDVENVDVYYLHRDDESRPVGEILETLNAFVEEGRVKLLGASNWKTARLREANAVSYTHLDVYKRQVLARAVYVVRASGRYPGPRGFRRSTVVLHPQGRGCKMCIRDSCSST